MSIFNSAEIKALKKENQELKNRLQSYSEKGDKLSDLEVILRKIRSEIAKMNETKENLNDEIKILLADKKIKESELNELSNRIPELNGVKRELQHAVLDYQEKLESIKRENS